MAKIVTFSRVFPAYHPRKGEETHFVEAILTQLLIDYTDHSYLGWLIKNRELSDLDTDNETFILLSKEIPGWSSHSEVFIPQFNDMLSENICDANTERCDNMIAKFR